MRQIFDTGTLFDQSSIYSLSKTGFCRLSLMLMIVIVYLASYIYFFQISM